MKFYLFFTSGGLCFFVLCHLPSLLVQGVEISLGYLKQEILGPLTDIIYSPIFFNWKTCFAAQISNRKFEGRAER